MRRRRGWTCDPPDGENVARRPPPHGGELVNALRADQVGSLLRPSGLLQARVDFRAGRLGREGLRAEEDRAIVEALHRQRECGIDVVTDGEFRRSWFMAGFL